MAPSTPKSLEIHHLPRPTFLSRRESQRMPTFKHSNISNSHERNQKQNLICTPSLNRPSNGLIAVGLRVWDARTQNGHKRNNPRRYTCAASCGLVHIIANVATKTLLEG